MVKDKDFTGLNSFGKRMFGKDKFYELTDKEISSAIIGLENMKKELKHDMAADYLQQKYIDIRKDFKSMRRWLQKPSHYQKAFKEVLHG
jgi:hypothetical protein